MMTENNHKTATDLTEAIESYQAALNEIESAALNLWLLPEIKSNWLFNMSYSLLVISYWPLKSPITKNNESYWHSRQNFALI